MTPSQGLARCLQLVVKTRMPSQEKLLQEILLHFAGTLAPYVEATGAGISTVQFTDTKNLTPKVTRVIAQLADAEIVAQAGIAPTPDASFLAAHLAKPVLQIDDASEFLAALPIETLGSTRRLARPHAVGVRSTSSSEQLPAYPPAKSGILFAQLFGHAIGFLFLPGLLIGERRFLQSARSNRRIVIKQGDTHESLARFVEMLALDLDVAGQQSRLRIHAPFRLEAHDFLGDLLRVIGFVRGNFRGPEREQGLRLRRRIGRHLEIFFVGGFRLGEILQLRFRVREIKPEIRLHVAEALALAENAEIFLRGRVILLVVILDSEPFEDFRRHPGVWNWPREIRPLPSSEPARSFR